MIGGCQVLEAAGACASFLAGAATADWTACVPDLDMTVAEVVAHAAGSCLWYAIDLSAGGKDLQPVEHRVKPESAPADLVDTLTTYAAVAAAVIDAAPAAARGFHPWGPADPSGFAAIACDELLIHTDDAARGLGRVFIPPEDLADAVLRRLFPWVEGDGGAWQLLRWANGRIALDDRPRLSAWTWQGAPLEEWDGEPPAGVVW